MERPSERANEGSTPAIGDGQAKALLNAPDANTLKGKRDRAILAVFLYHGLRCEELCRLRVRDLQERRGVKHLRIHGTRDKIRFVPAHPAAPGIDPCGEKGEFHTFVYDGPIFGKPVAVRVGEIITLDGRYYADLLPKEQTVFEGRLAELIPPV